MILTKLYKYLASLAMAVGAGLVIYFQRKTINHQNETIKDVEKTIKVKTAVSETNKQSEIEARNNVDKVTKNNQSMHDYLTGERVRDDTD